MTKLVEKAVAAISRLPSDTQDDIARLMLALTEDAPLSPDEAAAISEAEIEVARGECVPPATIRAFWMTAPSAPHVPSGNENE